MQKIFGFLIIGLFIFPGSLHAQEVAERVTILENPVPLNFVITRRDTTQWLIKLAKGCPTLKTGKTVWLGVRGALNGNNDYVSPSSDYRCAIAKAFEFNETFTILNVHRNQAQLTDKNGKKFTIFHESEPCNNLRAYFNKPIYVSQAGRQLAEGDKIFLPGVPLECVIKRVEPEKPDKKTVIPVGDVTRPTRVTHARALPRNGQAFVYWRKAEDNVRIDHYVVGFSHYQMDPKNLTFDAVPNLQKTRQTHLLITNLKNDRDYYFYVLAVDAAGNQSSLWSDPAHARVASSIALPGVPQTGLREIGLYQALESEHSFLLKWKKPPTVARFLVKLEADDVLDFSLGNTLQTSLRVLKKETRRGKKLKLTVSAFNLRGFIEEEKLEFEF